MAPRPLTGMTSFVENIRAALEALAVGDALGMPTEYMTYEEIRAQFTFVDHLVDASLNRIHPGLPKGSVTDDTEQVLYLMRQYLKDKAVTVDGTVSALLKWYEEKKPMTFGYIGPSSQRALEQLKRGVPPKITGAEGITCGGAMRMPAVALCTPRGSYEQLVENVHAALLPTHNTNIAIEAAAALAFGLHAAAMGNGVTEVVKKSLQGAELGRCRGNQLVGASTKARIELIASIVPSLRGCEQVMRFLYDVIGTEMISNQVVPVVFGITLHSWDNPWQAICIGASIGGDTDTIAALAGFFTTLLNGEHNIPGEIVSHILGRNQLVLDEIVLGVAQEFWRDV